MVIVVTPVAARPAAAATRPSACRAVMTGTFLQPSYPVFGWSAARYDQELSAMKAAGIRMVIDQWTVDMDANQAYYPAPSGWYPRAADMVGSLMASADRQGMGVWLGLGNVYAWQAHATDPGWLADQLYVDEQVASQLWALYPGKIRGWYVSNEVDDRLLSDPAAVGPMTSFFSSLAAWLHTHAGNLRVMTSPTYSSLQESTTQFAASVRSVLGTLDVVNVQDGGGSGYIGPSDITHWFSALAQALAGTRTTLWSDPDMYSVSGGPMAPAQLQADLKATCPYAAGRTGFSFSTQMSPAGVGTSTYYDAYRQYASTA
ncbi:MAG: DUF4434 domain-containing protein [Acidimicrobiales bacterium]